MAIRQNKIETVLQMIQKNHDLVNSVAKQPPKKDDGLSPLMVALKTGNLTIAKLLIESGANVNYIDKSEINNWNIPVFNEYLIGLACHCLDIISDIEFTNYLAFMDDLIKAGVDLNLKESVTKFTPLERLVRDTSNHYGRRHKLSYDRILQETTLNENDRNVIMENRIELIFRKFLDYYPQNLATNYSLNNEEGYCILRSSEIYKNFKIDYFALEILNQLLVEKYDQPIKDF